jgi:hypothetical protein
MTRQEEKIKVPSIRKLVSWHNRFRRVLEPNKLRTKLFGVDGKEVEYTARSEPTYVTLRKLDFDGSRLDDKVGYCRKTRANGSESMFRLAVPEAGTTLDTYLTYKECDLVLGSNYYVIDRGYSSPGPDIRQLLFKSSQGTLSDEDYNAVEIGIPRRDEHTIIPVVYYRVSKQRFRELRDWNTNLANLIEAVKDERAERKVPQ